MKCLLCTSRPPLTVQEANRSVSHSRNGEAGRLRFDLGLLMRDIVGERLL